MPVIRLLYYADGNNALIKYIQVDHRYARYITLIIIKFARRISNKRQLSFLTDILISSAIFLWSYILEARIDAFI